MLKVHNKPTSCLAEWFPPLPLISKHLKITLRSVVMTNTVFTAVYKIYLFTHNTDDLQSG